MRTASARIRPNCFTFRPDSIRRLALTDGHAGNPMLLPFNVWLEHFEYHANRVRSIPEDIPNILSPLERRLIGNSIACVQVAEQAQGGHLLRAAYRFAQQRDAAPVSRITELVIREQLQHGALLQNFMAGHDLPLKRTDWMQRIFCSLRRMGELELCLSVILTAELIGHVYYRALETATGCQRLRLLCRMLVADELAHVGFESDLLLAIRARRIGPLRFAVREAHRVFVTGSAAAVWFGHRRVLRAAGYGLFSFVTTCRAQYSFYLQPPRPTTAREPAL
jgi:hypothetical protein